MGGLFENNVAMLQALMLLAPEENVRIATVNLIDHLAEMSIGDSLNRDMIFEILAQNTLYLHDHIGEENPHGHDDEEQKLSEANLDEAMKRFRQQLGLKEEGEQ